MKKGKIAFVIGPLMVALAGFLAGAAPIDETISLLPENMKSLAQNTLSLAPSRYVDGINNYLTMIGLDTEAGANRGIQKFNLQLLEKNKCFAEIAGEFYGEFHERKIKELWQAIDKNDVDYVRRPHLYSKITDKGGQPGMLWEIANRYAQGDGNLAMALIGLCGHDDTMQFPGNFQFNSTEARLRSQKYLNGVINQVDFKEKTDRYTAELKKKDPRSSYSSDSLRRDISEINQSIECPSGLNTFYYPQSLGAEADIPQSLKEKIVRVQAPTKGGKVLPAKYYHLMAGAATSCQLVQGGLPKFVSKVLVEHAVNGYRAGRLCGEKLKSPAAQGLPRELKVALPIAFKMKAIAGLCQKNENLRSPECQMHELLGGSSFWEDPDLTDEIIQKKLERKLGELDAAELFAKSSDFQKSGGCKGPQFTKSVYNFLSKNGTGGEKNPCPKDWSETRCSNTRNVLATYAVDFEWSEAQQIAGLTFAAERCHPYKRGESIESSACSALQYLRASRQATSQDAPASGESGVQ